MRALILEHRQHQQLLVCRHTPKNREQKAFRTDREKARKRRGIFLFQQKKREKRVLNFFFSDMQRKQQKKHERGEERDVTIYLDVRPADLVNLEMNQVDFDVSLVVSSELDVSTRTVSISLVKPEPIEDGPDAGNIAWITGNVIIIIAGLVVFLGTSLVALRIIRKANAPLEEISTLDGYNMTIDGWDGEKSNLNL